MFKLINAKLSQLKANEGQVEGLPKNPRFIRDERFKALKKSIQDAPEMLELREIIAYDNNGEYVIIGGNMRFRAMLDLGYTETTIKLLDHDTTVDKLREYATKDNVEFGQTDWDIMANEWNTNEIKAWGVETWDGNPADAGNEPTPDATIVSPDDFGDEFSLNDGPKSNMEQVAFILTSEQADFIKEQLKLAQYDDADTFGNKNKNGNAIYSIVKQWADVKTLS